MVRAGAEGESEEFALDQQCRCRWDEVGDLSAVTTRDQVRELLIVTGYTDGGRLANHTGQIFRFAREIAVGDLVVLPTKRTRTLAVGLCAGGYEFRPGNPDGMRSSGTRARTTRSCCWATRRDSARRSGDRSFKAHGLERLVRAVLDAEGYVTRPVPGRWTTRGPLVSSRRGSLQVSQERKPWGVRNLLGAARNFDADQAPWNGFNRGARSLARDKWFNLHLGDLIDKITQNYDLRKISKPNSR